MTTRRTFLKASGIGLVFATIAPLGFLQHGHKVSADKGDNVLKDGSEKWIDMVWSTKDSRFIAISANSNNIMVSPDFVTWKKEKMTPKTQEIINKINYDNKKNISEG